MVRMVRTLTKVLPSGKKKYIVDKNWLGFGFFVCLLVGWLVFWFWVFFGGGWVFF